MLNSQLCGTLAITRLPAALSRGSMKKYSSNQIKLKSWLKSPSRKALCVAGPEVNTMSARYLQTWTKVVGTVRGITAIL